MVVFENCFYPLNIDPILSSTDFIFIKHANVKSSYRIFASYDSAQSDNYGFRRNLGNLLKQQLDASWRWHHVVTGEHLKRLFPRHTVKKLYAEEIPTVLIHQHTEHADYSILQFHGAKEVFDIPKEKELLSGTERTSYLKNLMRLYSSVYEHDDVLYTVARNVLRQLT
jgi:hypothetical protein